MLTSNNNLAVLMLVICVLLFSILVMVIGYIISASFDYEREKEYQQAQEWLQAFQTDLSNPRMPPALEAERTVQNAWLNNIFDHVFVIALPERRAHMEQFLVNNSICATFINPVLKSAFPTRVPDCLATYPSSNQGRLACHASHLRAISLGLSDPRNKNFLVFEDDLELRTTPQSAAVMLADALKSLPQDWDLLFLGKCWDCCDRSVTIGPGLQRIFCPKCRHALAYSRKGAEYILNNFSFPMYNNGDMMITEFISEGKLLAYGINPSIFFQDRLALGSNLGNNPLPPPPCREPSPLSI